MEGPSPQPRPLAGVDPTFFAQHNGSRYRTPIDLQVSPDRGLRFLVMGGCLAQAFPDIAAMINPLSRAISSCSTISIQIPRPGRKARPRSTISKSSIFR